MIEPCAAIKPICAVDYQPAFVERHVAWLKKDRESIIKVGMVVIALFEALVLTLSLIGIPLLIKAVHLSNAINAKRNFYHIIENKKPPAIEEKIHLKSATRTFNHVNVYAIENGVIWYRRKEGLEAWTPLLLDGAPDDVPVMIDCDGANLIVMDQNRKIHYKKILIEYRKEELDPLTNRHFKENKIEFDDFHYFTVDKTNKDNWKDKWFSLPVVNHIMNLFCEKRLTIPPHFKTIAISHRGRYNNFSEDKVKQRHNVETGVTTLYALSENGRDIHKYDPWSPAHSKLDLALPETENTIFEAEKISASASTIMAIGYETHLSTKQKTLKIITRHADIDTEGGNPILPYGFSHNPDDPSIFVLPVETQWKEHHLPITKDNLTNWITILQTGEGNDQRELRIAGQNNLGEWGFYRKNLMEEAWEFTPQEEMRQEGKVLPFTLSALPDAVLQTTVHNYKGTLAHPRSTQNIQMKNFGERSIHSKIKFEYLGNKYRLDLYKRATFWNFLGFKRKKYDLVIPENFHDDVEIKKILGKSKVIRLKVDENEKTIVLATRRFILSFAKQTNL